MSYRAGLVGCGRMGCGFDGGQEDGIVRSHAGAYQCTEGVQLVALCDLDEAKLERYGNQFGVDSRYRNFQEMFARERLDLVSVCTWNDSHRQIIESAVAHGVKGIFCEKPLADHLDACDAMIQCCEAKNVILMVDHLRRFDRFYQEIASYLKADRLGRIQQVTCYYTAGIANTGSHLFDLLRFFFGEVETVSGAYSHNPSRDPNDPNLDGWLKFERDVVAVIQACDVQAYTIFEIHLLGTLGRFRILSHGFDAAFDAVRDSSHLAGYRELVAAVSPVDPNIRREPMAAAIRHFVKCLERREKPLSSGEDGRKALEVICALRESADRNGAPICLPLRTSGCVIQSR